MISLSLIQPTCSLRMCYCLLESRCCNNIWYMSQVTYKNPTNSREFRCKFHRIAVQRGTKYSCCVHGMSVLCMRNVRALSMERPCSVHGTSVLCPQNVCTLSAECLCSVCGRVPMLPKTLVARIPDTLSADPSRRFHRLVVKCPQTLHEVRITVLK